MPNCSGVKADGSLKVRPIDDLSASKVNAHTAMTEKTSHDTLDKLAEALKVMHCEHDIKVSLWHLASACIAVLQFVVLCSGNIVVES